MTARRLIVARHAESEANVVNSLHSTVPGPPLSPLGREQAASLTGALADEDVRAVWSSTMTRARQTAAPIARAHGLDVRVHDSFREVFLGDLHPRNDVEAHQVFTEIYTDWMVAGNLARRIPGGESGEEVAARWLAALDDVLATHRGGTAVVVSHGAATRLGLARFAGVDPVWAMRNYLPNIGMVVLDDAAGVWQCRSWGGLEPERQPTPGQRVS